MARTFFRSALAASALLALGLSVGCADDQQMHKVEQEVGDLKLEVFRLRQQMEESNKKADAESQAASEARAQNQRFQADLQETLRTMQDTTRQLNNRLGSLPKAGAAPRMAAQPEAQQAPGSEEDKAYNAAVLDYNRGNYPLAVEEFELFLKTYPQSPRKPDGLFFLGLSQYNQKTFDKAQAAFEQILREAPTSSQFLPAKLKRGQCLLRLGLKAAAAKSFKELATGFPGTPEARTAQQELSDMGL